MAAATQQQRLSADIDRWYKVCAIALRRARQNIAAQDPSKGEGAASTTNQQSAPRGGGGCCLYLYGSCGRGRGGGW